MIEIRGKMQYQEGDSVEKRGKMKYSPIICYDIHCLLKTFHLFYKRRCVGTALPYEVHGMKVVWKRTPPEKAGLVLRHRASRSTSNRIKYTHMMLLNFCL